MSNLPIISIYGSHNAAVVVYHNERTYVVEAERILGYKNAGLSQYKVIKQENISLVSDALISHACDYLEVPKKFSTCLYQNTDTSIDGAMQSLQDSVEADSFVECDHHFSHASGSFYQSNFRDALIFSFDGGGNDGYFNVYLANRKTGIEEIKRFNINLGFPYMIFGQYFSDIRKESTLSDGNLVYSGKIMGLDAYSSPREEWIPFFEDFYDCNMHNNPNAPDPENHYQSKIKKLSEDISLEINEENRLSKEAQFQVAATSQRAFENIFLKYALPFIKKYSKLPIILTGGCALNIILNTKIKSMFKRPVFVAPNSNDCGLAVGMLLSHTKPYGAADITYSGTPLLDYNSLFENILWSDVQKSEHSVLAKKLLNGSIVGVARGRSEHGPRALGNRSILCNPSVDGMKDMLNEKVKHREWFRPFAPVVRLEDVNKYFIFDGESRHMTFSAKVRKKWQDKLKAITHVDGTARIQTVTREQNPWLYDLLTEFDYISDHAVLLNTSFNVNGKPILSTIKDAFKIFNESGMDTLIVEDYMICK
jgi:carbamoyltransferase